MPAFFLLHTRGMRAVLCCILPVFLYWCLPTRQFRLLIGRLGSLSLSPELFALRLFSLARCAHAQRHALPAAHLFCSRLTICVFFSHHARSDSSLHAVVGSSALSAFCISHLQFIHTFSVVGVLLVPILYACLSSTYTSLPLSCATSSISTLYIPLYTLCWVLLLDVVAFCTCALNFLYTAPHCSPKVLPTCFCFSTCLPLYYHILCKSSTLHRTLHCPAHATCRFLHPTHSPTPTPLFMCVIYLSTMILLDDLPFCGLWPCTLLIGFVLYVVFV